MVTFIAIFAMASLAGNIYLAISWKRATQQALLADVYLNLVNVTRKRNNKALEIVAEKEKTIRDLEKQISSLRTAAELTDDLNRLFRGDTTASSGKPRTVQSPKPKTDPAKP